jgi:hypothetical protein
MEQVDEPRASLHANLRVCGYSATSSVKVVHYTERYVFASR